MKPGDTNPTYATEPFAHALLLERFSALEPDLEQMTSSRRLVLLQSTPFRYFT